MLNESVWQILMADTELWRIYEGRRNISAMMGNNQEPFTSMATSVTFGSSVTAETSLILEASMTSDSSMTTEPVGTTECSLIPNITTSEQTQTQQEGNFPWFNVTKLDQCDAAYEELLHYMGYRIVYLFSNFRHESIKFFDAADDFARQNDVSESVDCYTLIEEGRQLKNAFTEEFEWVFNARDGLEASLYSAERLLERYLELQTPRSLYEGFDARLMELCTWRTEFAVTFQDKGKHFIQNIGKAWDSLRRAEPLLRRWAEHLYAIGIHGAFPIQGIMEQYLNARVSKQALAQGFLAPESVAENEEFLGNLTEMKQLLKVLL